MSEKSISMALTGITEAKRNLLGAGVSSESRGRLPETLWSNKHWKKKFGYHKRSLSEAAMFRMKKRLDGTLSLRNYKAQAGETCSMIKTLN